MLEGALAPGRAAPCQTGQRAGTRRSVVPGPPGWHLEALTAPMKHVRGISGPTRGRSARMQKEENLVRAFESEVMRVNGRIFEGRSNASCIPN
jgi:hypothetical protein